jgi:hypothetical protein
MSEKDDGQKKPFYENIVSKRTRAQKPPKGDKADGASSRGRADSRERNDSARGEAEAARPGSSARFGREATKREGASRERSERSRPGRDSGKFNRGPDTRSQDSRGQPARTRSDDSRPRDSRFGRDDSRRPQDDTRSDRFRPRDDSRRDRGDSRFNRDNSRDAGTHAPRSSGPHGPGRHFAQPAEFTPVFGSLSKDTRALLDAFPEIVQSVMPLDSKKQLLLPTGIRDLSHELTDERGERRVGYLNDPAVLSAYVRYYMWWNLVRLTRLFTTLPITLADGDAAVDLGSGPLTLPVALWMARPDLRARKITWYCVDISQNALSAGEEIFLALAARTGEEPWQIVRVKGECGVSLRRRVKLVASANMFNELFWDNPLPLEAQSKHHAEEIASYAEPEASILVIEPGIPRAGRFVSLMRDSLARLAFAPVAPCPHEGTCPFPGLRYGKWCHFVFDTSDAPAKLHRLSDEAGLVKERAALSFIYAERKAVTGEDVSAEGTDGVVSSVTQDDAAPSERVSRLSDLFTGLRVRVTSDPIKLPDYYVGRYGCSERGMVMLTGTYQAADWLKTCNSGSLVEVPQPDMKNPEIDPKTGAIVIRL